MSDLEDSAAHRLLCKMVCAFVDHTDEVTIKSIERDGTATFTISVHPDDLGKIIGKQNRNAQSMRIIMSGAGMRLHRRFTVDIEGDPTITRS